jgi:hypothetical protein
MSSLISTEIQKGQITAVPKFAHVKHKNILTHINRVVEVFSSWIEIDYVNSPAHSLTMIVQTGAVG